MIMVSTAEKLRLILIVCIPVSLSFAFAVARYWPIIFVPIVVHPLGLRGHYSHFQFVFVVVVFVSENNKFTQMRRVEWLSRIYSRSHCSRIWIVSMDLYIWFDYYYYCSAPPECWNKVPISLLLIVCLSFAHARTAYDCSQGWYVEHTFSFITL